MAKIGIDVDGVLADFNGTALKLAHEMWPSEFPLDMEFNTWYWFGRGERSHQLWARIMRTTNWWMSLPAYPNEIHELAKFLVSSHGHEIWFVTARRPTAGYPVALQTELWWKAIGLNVPYNYVGVITCDPEYKANLYRDIDIQFSVDDKLETVQACDRILGHKAFLLNRPWNQQEKTVHRIDSLTPMFDTIKESDK